MSKMDYQFKQQKTAKVQSGLCNTNNVITEIQDQIEKIITLSNDILNNMKKIGQRNHERGEISRRTDVNQIRETNLTGRMPDGNVNKAIANRQSPRPSWKHLEEEERCRQKVRNLRGPEVTPQEVGQKCRGTACMGTMSKTTGANQTVSIKVSMVSLEPEYKSSELVVPERRPSRGDPKLEEQSVGGGVALPPCIMPDAQQIRLLGGPQSPR
jgi:hypothetical protein